MKTPTKTIPAQTVAISERRGFCQSRTPISVMTSSAAPEFGLTPKPAARVSRNEKRPGIPRIDQNTGRQRGERQSAGNLPVDFRGEHDRQRNRQQEDKKKVHRGIQDVLPAFREVGFGSAAPARAKIAIKANEAIADEVPHSTLRMLAEARYHMAIPIATARPSNG